MSSNYSLYNGADPWAGTDWYRPAPNPTLAYAEQAVQPPPQFDPYEPMPQYQPGPQRPLGTLEALAASGNRSFLGRLGAIKLAKRQQQEQQKEEAYKRQFYEWKTRREDAENRKKDLAERKKEERENKKKYKTEWLKGRDGVHPHTYEDGGQPDYHPDDVPHKESADTQEEKMERLREGKRLSAENAENMARLGASLRPERVTPEPPTSIQEYNHDVAQGYKGTRLEWERQRAETNRKPEADPYEKREGELTSLWTEQAMEDQLTPGMGAPGMGGKFKPSPGVVSPDEASEIRRRLHELGRGRQAVAPKKAAAPAPSKGGRPQTYSKAEDVKNAVKAGALSKAEAKRILKSQFGYSD